MGADADLHHRVRWPPLPLRDEPERRPNRPVSRHPADSLPQESTTSASTESLAQDVGCLCVLVADGEIARVGAVALPPRRLQLERQRLRSRLGPQPPNPRTFQPILPSASVVTATCSDSSIGFSRRNRIDTSWPSSIAANSSVRELR